MKYKLFLFDLDDTLLDFRQSEQRSFLRMLAKLGIDNPTEGLFQHYQQINTALWADLEYGKITKELLRTERFKQLFERNRLALNAELASNYFLDFLPETVVLMDYAVEICQFLSTHGEIGIITNGFHTTQTRRIQNSALAPYISFISVSDMCGFAKPDARFFDYTTKMAKDFTKESTIIIGDRLEADIHGAANFGIDSCWFNVQGLTSDYPAKPTYQISHLSELITLLH